MANYRVANYKQCQFVAVNLEEQLLPGTFEHTLHYLIANYLDLSVHIPAHREHSIRFIVNTLSGFPDWVFTMPDSYLTHCFY